MTRKFGKTELSTIVSKPITYYNLDVIVSPEEDTVWLSQKQICSLFESSKANISERINHILSENELDDSVVRNLQTTASDGKTYNVKCSTYSFTSIDAGSTCIIQCFISSYFSSSES